jgi:hypothetical protein
VIYFSVVSCALWRRKLWLHLAITLHRRVWCNWLLYLLLLWGSMSVCSLQRYRSCATSSINFVIKVRWCWICCGHYLWLITRSRSSWLLSWLRGWYRCCFPSLLVLERLSDWVNNFWHTKWLLVIWLSLRSEWIIRFKLIFTLVMNSTSWRSILWEHKVNLYILIRYQGLGIFSFWGSGLILTLASRIWNIIAWCNLMIKDGF